MARTALRVSEAEFTSSVIDLAHVHGWLVAHFRPARTESGWRTPVQGDGKGFPDLVLVHKKWRRCAVAELKGPNGRLRPEQFMWLEAFAETVVETYTWYPSDWDDIERILGRRTA